jgi:hypothetical protein
MLWRRGNGAQGRNRTTDTAIFSRMLYQLSYLGVAEAGRLAQGRGGIKSRRRRMNQGFGGRILRRVGRG